MKPDRTRDFSRDLRTLFNFGMLAGLTDGQLLERFLTRGDEDAELAFAALVERHGPMVLRLCRRILNDLDDAQDAAQATFLVLVKRAASVRNRESIASWLYGVASRVAACTKSAAARRRRHELRYAARAGALLAEGFGGDRDEDEAVLHEEVARLPEPYRDAVLLCDFEGLTHEQAAQHLGCPSGTIKSRLARGRARLGDRLRRRGLSPLAGLPWPSLSGRTGVLSHRAFVGSTTSVALRAAADPRTAGTVPAAVVSLANGALWMMRLNALKQWSTNTLLAAGLIGTVLATAGLRADSEPTRSAGAVASSASPAPAPSQEAMVVYDVAFIGAPGLSLRKSGFKPDYRLGPTTSLAFLSDVEMDLLARQLGGIPGASLEKARSLTTRLGSPVVVRIPDNFRGPAWIDLPETSDRPANVDPPKPQPVEPKEGEEPKGCEVRLSGWLSADGNDHFLQLSVSSLHLVALHTIVDPAGVAAKVEEPELSRADIDRRITLPASGGGVLLGLGLTRTVDADGASTVAERLVLIRTRKPTAPAATSPTRR